jgi:broad specificity phosphatase PhoE
MPPRVLYIARHGETDWNVAGRWQGHTDVPLNANGRAQALTIAVALRGQTFAGVVASDLARAHETARIVAAELGLAVAYTDPDLRERHFGPFEGLTRDECAAYHPDEWRAWILDKVPPGGGETQEELSVRVHAAVGRAALHVAPAEVPVLLVSHGGSMRALLTAALGEVPPPIANGAIWRITWDERLIDARQL